MVADAHAAVVVEQLHAAHLEKLVITLSPAPLPAAQQRRYSAPGNLGAAPFRDDSASIETPQSSAADEPSNLNALDGQPALSLTAESQRKAMETYARGADVKVAQSAPSAAQLRSSLRRSIILVGAVAAWYTANIGLVLTNRCAFIRSCACQMTWA